MDHKSKEKAVKGVAWTSAANWGCQLLTFCFFTALARLLNPQTFGLIALASVYIAFIQIFVTQGFGMAIIQRPVLEEEHIDSAFWIAMATAVLFCFLSISLAGLIGHLFNEPRIAPVLSWLSLSMLFNALCSVQTAILTRELNFRPLAIRSLAATVAGGVVGVTLASMGFGVWSLVGQQLVAAILGCIFLWFSVPWRPRLLISRRHLRDLYGFSLSMTGNDVLWFLSQKSDQTIVGYGFGASGLGPYSLASKLTTLAYDGIVGPFQGVAFPAFSKFQSEPSKFEGMLHKFCEMSSFLCLPIFAGLAVVAPDIVPLLFGSRWIAAIPILQILSLYGVGRVLLACMHPLMLAKGRAGLYLLMNVVLSGLTCVGCLIAIHWNPEAIAFSMVATILVFWVIFLDVARRRLEVRTLPLLRSFAFPVFCSLVMSAAVGLLRSFVTKNMAHGAGLAISVLTGVAVYVSTACLLRPGLVKAICGMAGSSLLPAKWGREVKSPRVEDDTEKAAIELFEEEKTILQ
jgi:O-antigen/teichoic acid export membrane protein